MFDFPYYQLFLIIILVCLIFKLRLMLLSLPSYDNIQQHYLKQVKDGMDLNEAGVNQASQGASLATQRASLARGLASGLPEALLLLASFLLASL